MLKTLGTYRSLLLPRQFTTAWPSPCYRAISFNNHFPSPPPAFNVIYRTKRTFRNEEEQEQYRIWQMLIAKDEADRTKLAELLSKVTAKLENEAAQTGEEVEDKQEPQPKKRRYIKQHKTETLESIKELLHQCIQTPEQLIERSRVDAALAKAKTIFQNSENINQLAAPRKGEFLNIVGDLHGSLQDLEMIFHKVGWPSKTNRFIFNGDFVNRGKQGIEVVCILFMLKTLMPKSVFLNRGNHEDDHLGRAYGFYDEVIAKYNDTTLYSDIISVFSYLPLCAIVENTAFVVHGGLSREGYLSLEDIRSLDRSQFQNTVTPQKHKNEFDDDSVTTIQSENNNSTEIADAQLLEDLMWSDPTVFERGTRTNDSRGAGTLFGLNVVNRFLKSIDIPFLIRSHECVEDGYEQADCNDGKWLYTVFSCSNYSGGDNYGSVLQFKHGALAPIPIQYHAGDEDQEEPSYYERNQQAIIHFICKQEDAILNACCEHSKNGITIDTETLVSVLTDCIGVDLDWATLLKLSNKKEIHFRNFLSYFKQMGSKTDRSSGYLLRYHDELSVLFKLFDDGDSCIYRDEFTAVCDVLNEFLTDDTKCDPDKLFLYADTDKSGYIDRHEFTVMFSKIFDR